MIGLLIAIILFNFIAFKTKRRMSSNQIVHIWLFTIAFETLFDVFVEFKFHAYWYFSRDIDWAGILPHIFLVPAANIIFLNWYPQKSSKWQRLLFFSFFVVAILIYERITILPPPWGYFHYGWWRLWHAVILDPILLLILLGFYNWICKLEKKAAS
ncbi:hypothetical protein [Neobacillus bataviensis]|uniref:hypothetical protein n=1 Tax=Neobacillus bataviensis TaxID=220685 RepID=UPI001CC0740B|nr:hypothetical protein [Neobacillus bataviensis]